MLKLVNNFFGKVIADERREANPGGDSFADCENLEGGRIADRNSATPTAHKTANRLTSRLELQILGDMTNDVLKIKNMAFYAYHGLFDEEAKLGQKFEVDVEVYGDFRGFAREKLPQAVDYPRVCALVEQVVTGERFGLIEALADRIAEVLQSELGLEKLRVRVRKPNPPVPVNFDGVEVEVWRGR